MIVNVDWWALLTSPHAMAHHPRADPVRWQTMLEAADFEIVEQVYQADDDVFSQPETAFLSCSALLRVCAESARQIRELSMAPDCTERDTCSAMQRDARRQRPMDEPR